MKIFIQSLVVILSFAFIFVWQQSILSGYTIQTLGFLVFLFIITTARKRKTGSVDPVNFFNNDKLSIFALNTIIFLLVFATGSLNSSLFYLLCFLGFGIAFVFEPSVVFVFMLGAVLLFLPEAMRNDVSGNMLKLSSVVLITPLAYFFGKEYRKGEEKEGQLERLKAKTQAASDKIAENVREVLDDEDNPREAEKLNEILEETQKLRK